MSIRHGALAALVLTWVVAVQAQSSAPAKPDAKSDTKADTKAEEAAAAMERAKRMAAGPMRIILEASKAKRREGESAALPTSQPSAPPVLSAASPAETVQASTVAAPTATDVSTQITLSSETLQGHSVAPVPGLERSVARVTPVLSLPAANVELPQLVDALVKPQLTNRVDPDLPQRMLDDLGRNAVVTVDLNIRADGRVSGVGIVTVLPARVQRLLVSALEQWRYEPLPSDRVHRVQLVFNAESGLK